MTIVGHNLGRSFDDIRDAVWISNQKCTPIEAEYVVATKLDFSKKLFLRVIE